MRIDPMSASAYAELLGVWEASVRATHGFLNEADIEALKPLVLHDYFNAVELWGVRGKDGVILGFCGVAESRLEMLFVGPESRGKGIGSALCRFAIRDRGVTGVDVNEQNCQAVGFYEHMGFRCVGRSALDGHGNPFPLLHMVLVCKAEKD